jgi:hypothetical protein
VSEITAGVRDLYWSQFATGSHFGIILAVYSSGGILMSKELVPMESISDRIFLIRGQKVMLDSDLAQLYGVETSSLNRQVRRNIDRFPGDFIFQLTKEELKQLVPIWHQFRTQKHSYILPYAFTEQGIAMLSSVLRSKRAVQVNIAIMRAFVRLRRILATHKELAHKFEQLERKVGVLDSDVKAIFDAIKQLMSPPPGKPKKIGFLK